MGLKKYISKRNFKKTSEPRENSKKNLKSSNNKLIFVVQKHHARNLHYDFRLELGNTLKSWAVPKGPSLNPTDKRLAVEVEDHPLDYADFEGVIPKGEYGAGQVLIWDKGYWQPPENAAVALKKGHLDFELKGKKLKGLWSLVRMGPASEKNNWLLIKKKDEYSRTDYNPTSAKITKKKRLPEFIKPQLAQLVDKVPEGSDWLHEIKFDGYRTLCRIDNNEVRFLTRSGLDWTLRYKKLIETAKKLKLQNAILDGEIVWLNEKGQSDFQQLQNALSENNFDRIYYYIFDLLFLNGTDIRDKPLKERKLLLEKLLKPLKKSRFLYSEHFEHGKEMHREACQLQLEGVLSKDANAPYTSGRTPIWQKTKCSLRQEFVIGGFTTSKGIRPFAALLLGYYDEDKKLHYAGRVGTGFTDITFDKISHDLKKLTQTDSPFAVNTPFDKNIQWLKPKLVAEVEFKNWTSDKILRQPSFKGLREDKVSTAITLENEKTKKIQITHPDRIIYPHRGTTKKEVLNYYEEIAPYLLPYVQNRPVSILRCQKTTTSGCYYQKHSKGRNLVGINSKELHYRDKNDSALIIENKTDLVQLAQAGTIEIHGWQALFTDIARPDQIVFDLDPDSAKLWGRMTDTAFEIRSKLLTLGLESFVKVTGGKGLHIHVPIAPVYTWNQVKAFSKGLMQILADQNPEYYTTHMSKISRKEKIFLDYLRNGYGATAVIPYSLRARKEPTIALPIAWKDLKNSTPDEFIYSDVLKLIKKRKDPWPNYFKLRQRISVLESQSIAELIPLR